MPVAVMSGASPTSPSKISKAAFFRARSPGLYPANGAHHDGNGLSARLAGLGMGVSGVHAAPDGGRAAARDEYEIPSPPRSGENGHPDGRDGYDDYDEYDGRDAPRGLARGPSRRQHDYEYQSSYRPPPARHDTGEPPHSQSLSASASSSSAPPPTSSSRYTPADTSVATSPAAESAATFAGSDEMLLTLLASQAAVDCERLPVAGWEEVEAWKKELSLLSTRLESLQARHQREVKILTAARTLQKLNNSNKRLEQSEKRVEAAEKEVLLLRDREASLRQRLMEHWSGVMAWEVRRLERVAAEAQARARDPAVEAEQVRRLAQLEAAAKQAGSRADELETIVERRTQKADELEEVVLEMGRRERASEAELAGLHEQLAALSQGKEAWARERAALVGERERWASDRTALAAQREAHGQQVRALEAERDAARDTVGRASVVDRAIAERVRAGLGAVLGRTVDDAGMARAVEDVQALVGRKDGEAAALRAELGELGRGLEEEVRRAGADRDGWKGRAEGAERKMRDELAAAEKQLMAYADKVSDLGLRNESLSASLAVAQAALSDAPPARASMQAPASRNALETRLGALTAELDAINRTFADVWAVLPSPAARASAGLTDADDDAAAGADGRASSPALSPLSPRLDPSALARMYDDPRAGEFGGVAALAARVRAAAADGRRLALHLAGAERERERHKANAAKAARLVDDSRRSLETYQRQVALLEDRLAGAGAAESGALDALNAARAQLDDAQAARRALEAEHAGAKEDAKRLADANAQLSARALDMAEESEGERRSAVARLQAAVDDAASARDAALARADGLAHELADAADGRDDERAAAQAQRIQLLDELNTLQAEVADLRTQLRAAKR